ncbi:MAG: ChaN family lipoprotein [Crocinitomicaceae bacterium]
MKKLLLAFICFLSIPSIAQVKASYKIYDSNGKELDYGKMLKDLKARDIILFGELHNSAIAHWLQLELTKDLDAKNDLVLGAEMLEADNQDEVDAYLNDSIDASVLDTLARLWSNHDTDYAPLLNYAKEEGLSFIATNIPRKYANKVYKSGGFEALDSLTTEEKSWIAPLPIAFDPELPQYKEILEMMGEHGTPSLVMAQAIKDATMAYFILENYQMGQQFLHFNGAFHSDFYEGILWYLKRSQPKLNYATISTVTQKNIDKLEKEYKGKADFIIVVDEDVTSTY